MSKLRPFEGKKIILYANRMYSFWFFRREIIMELRNLGADIYLVAERCEYAPNLERLGFNMIYLNNKLNNYNPLTTIKSYYEIHKIIQEIKPDLLLSYTIKANILGPIAAYRLGVKRIVPMVTGVGTIFMENSIKYRILRPIVTHALRRAFSKADKVVVVNKEDEKLICERIGVKKEDIILVPGAGVDLERFSPASPDEKASLMDELNLSKDKRYVLFAGRFLKQKGLDILLEAFSYINDKKVNLLLIGSTDRDNPSSIDIKIFLDSDDRIKYIGLVNDMQKYYKIADIVVLPAKREGMSTVLMEAAACGVPIVTTDVPGCKEAVIHGKTGLIVPYGDPLALKQAIETLLDNHDMHANMRQAAAQYSYKFSRKKVVTKMILLYKNLIL